MQFVRVLVAILVAVGFAAAPASAGKRGKSPKKRVIIIDRSNWYGPRPPPHDRYYVGPAPAIGAPMQPVPRVAPLAQPPIR